MRLFRILTINQEVRQCIGRSFCIIEPPKSGEPLVLYYVDPVTRDPKAMASSSPVSKVAGIFSVVPIVNMWNKDFYIFKPVLDLSMDETIREFVVLSDLPALAAVEIINVLKSVENPSQAIHKIAQILGQYKKEEK